MSGRFFLSGVTPVTAAGVPYALATIDWYLVGTTTRDNTYTTAALTVAHPNPITLAADGRIPEIFLSQQRMKCVFKDSGGNTIAGLSFDGIDKSVERIKAAAAPSPTYPGLQWHDTTTGKLWERNAADSGWNDRGPIDSFNAATVTDQLTGTSTSLSATPDSVASLWQRGPDLASAATISLPAGGGLSYNITGTTGITAISSAQGGRKIEFRFAAALTLTHNSTSLILPGGANITTSAGDIIEFTNDAATDVTGSNWRVTNVLLASGSPTIPPAVPSCVSLLIKNNTTTPNTKIDVTIDHVVMINTSGFAKYASAVSGSVDFTTTGANALDTGALAASTWYYIWVISNPTTTALLGSISSTAPTMPSGYTYKARLGAVRTNGSTQFWVTRQRGNRAWYSIQSAGTTTAWPIIVAGATGNPATPTFTTTAVSSFVPATAVAISVKVNSANASISMNFSNNGNHGPTASTTKPAPFAANSDVNTGLYLERDIFLEDTNIYLAISGAATNTFATGWIDNVTAS